MPKGRKAILIDARIASDQRILALPSDAARWAFVVALTEAKWTNPEGRFINLAHLRGVLGIRARYVSDLLKIGLITVEADGAVAFPAWSEWQTPTEAAAVRTARWRAKRREQEAGILQLLPLDRPSGGDAGDVTVTSRVRHGDRLNANANANAVVLSEQQKATLEAGLAELLRITGWPTGPKGREKDHDVLSRLIVEFPAVDTVKVIRTLSAWIVDRGVGKNPRLRLRNFFVNAVKFQERDAAKLGHIKGSLPPTSVQVDRVRQGLDPLTGEAR